MGLDFSLEHESFGRREVRRVGRRLLYGTGRNLMEGIRRAGVGDEFFCGQVIELIPGGADVPVTNANRLQYVALVADWHLNGGSRGAAATAFARGLSQVWSLPPV